MILMIVKIVPSLRLLPAQFGSNMFDLITEIYLLLINRF